MTSLFGILFFPMDSRNTTSLPLGELGCQSCRGILRAPLAPGVTQACCVTPAARERRSRIRHIECTQRTKSTGQICTHRQSHAKEAPLRRSPRSSAAAACCWPLSIGRQPSSQTAAPVLPALGFYWAALEPSRRWGARRRRPRWYLWWPPGEGSEGEGRSWRWRSTPRTTPSRRKCTGGQILRGPPRHRI